MNEHIRPNFLFIITDQHRADHLGCYGNRIVRTPHIDSLASGGLVFDRFYVATPVCMPNRSTILTGRMPSVHGCRSNGIPLPLSARTFVEVLAANDYKTALIGKSHVQNMEDKPSLAKDVDTGDLVRTQGMEEATREDIEKASYAQERRSNWRTPEHEITLPYYGFQHVELCNAHGDGAFGHYRHWALDKEPNFDNLCGRDNSLPSDFPSTPQAWRTRVPESLYSTSYIAERSISFIDNHAKANGQEPFFLQCSFPDPHHPFTPPGKYWGMYNPEDIKPPNLAMETAQPPLHVERLRAERSRGASKVESPRLFAAHPNEIRNITALTYGMVTMIDDAVGAILGALRSSGLLENTIVVFTSDHGDLMGDHGLMLKGPLHYQGLIRVPFIWAEPRGEKGHRDESLASSVDIARTILSRAGLAGYNGLQGRDLLSAHSSSTAVLIEEENQHAYPGFEPPIRVRTLVTNRFRLTVYRGMSWGELYDLERDPFEHHNLWDAASHNQIKSTLLEQLAQKMLDTFDQSPRPTRSA